MKNETKVINETLNINTYMENPYRNIVIDRENKLISASYYLDGHPNAEEQTDYNTTLNTYMGLENITGCVDITDDKDNYIRYALYTYA